MKTHLIKRKVLQCLPFYYALRGGEVMKVNTKKLEIAMANACISARELSEKSGVSQFTITRIQSDANVFPATVGKIAKALNVNVTEIIEAEG